MPFLHIFCLICAPFLSPAQEWSPVSAKLLEFPPPSVADPPHPHHRRGGNLASSWSSQRRTGGGSAKDLQKKVKRPPSLGHSAREPLSVKLGFYLESLGDFRETQMSFDVDLYMYSSWKDPSLQHAGPDMAMINENAVRKQLWLPDLYFANARQATHHEVTVPNFNLFIAPDGTVAYSSRVTLTVACNLNLVDYPMDYQQCHIRVLSYAYIAKIVNVTWFRHSPIMYNPDIDLPEFEIDRVEAEYCDGTYRYAVTDRSSKTDRFSCLMGNLYLRRRIGFNMVQSYIPTGLIVIISWVSFWIDRRAVPARVTLSFTALLTMTTIGNGMRFALPRVSYAKAIDYWFGGCMLFVFLAMVEFALVNSYMRRSDKYERLASKYKRKNSTDILTLSPIFASELAQSYAEMLKLRRKSNFLDFASSPISNRRKLTKEGSRGDETSLSLSEDTTDQSTKASRKSSKSRMEEPGGQENSGVKREEGRRQGMEGRSGPEMNGSYYDNMHLNPERRASDRQALVGQMPNGNVKSRVGAVKRANAVAFAVDEGKGKEAPVEDEYLWPKAEGKGDEGAKAESIEPNPQLYCKYLEVSQLLSRRALNIDKVSRILFPLAFVLFNCIYWGYYLVLRKHKFD